MSVRSFPGPWRVEVTEGGHFVVKDALGFSICYVYARKDEALRNSYMTHAEAMTMAEQIARLPELAGGRLFNLFAKMSMTLTDSMLNFRAHSL